MENVKLRKKHDRATAYIDLLKKENKKLRKMYRDAQNYN
jgi:hypothetical protein|nr:MAG TPA: GEMININ, MULTICILIN CYCLE, DNA REPLICATION LICENSING [Bacteriophage sp.]